MPRVPSYDNLQTAPGVAPVREFQAPAIRNFGAEGLQEAGRGLMQATGPFAKMVREKQDEADQVRVLEAEDQLERARLKLLYDPDRGALSRKGADALDAGDRPLPQLYGEQFDKAVSEIANRLGNDRQKMAFQAAAQRRATQFRGDLTRHVAREFERHREGVLTGAIDTSVQGAAAEWGNVERVAEHAARARQAAGALALARGLAGNEGRELERQAVSGVHEAVVANALAGQKIDYAREYFDQHSGELDANARLRLTQALERGAKDERIYAHVDRIWGASRGNLTGALRVARDSVPADLRSEVEARLRQYNADGKAAQAQGERAAKDAAWDHIVAGGTVDSLPSNLRERLSGEDFLRIQDYEARRAARKEAEARRNFKPDLNEYSRLRAMSADEPWRFAQENLAIYAPVLGDSLTTTLINEQSRISRSDAKALQEGKIISRAKSLGRTLLQEAGIKTTGNLDEKQAAELAAFEGAIVRSVDAKQRELERPLTDREMRFEVADQLQSYTRSGSGFLGFGRETARAFELSPDQTPADQGFVARVYDDIPMRTRVQIEARLAPQFPGGIPQFEVERMYTIGVQAGIIDGETGMAR